ncbi:MAG: hypothetical protein QHI38_03970 [Armatimonadota bacterium]|nr:hypothetical protein [Armatimonadota bacterium]
MWLAFVLVWIAGSALLYYVLVSSAQEPRHPECMECKLTDCADCPLAVSSSGDYNVERAA